MQNILLDYRIKPWEIYGGKRPFFVRYSDVIGDVISDFKLEPLKEEVLMPTKRLAAPPSNVAAEAMIYIDPDIYGGKRFAHLHYRGEIYMLNKEQWQTFTGRIKNDLIERLHTANMISVEQLQDINDAIDPIA